MRYAPSGRMVVLCYHSIHPTKVFATVTPALFEEHLRWLRENCELVPFSRILEGAKDHERSRPTVAVTFDDGYADNYEYAFPLLSKWCVPTTFFVTVGLLERDPGVIRRFCLWRNDASYEDVRPLEWNQVKEMMRAGMEVGSHTYSHANLARLDPASVEVELRLSKEILQERLGERINMMAYPFGRPKLHFTRESVEVARRVGYEYGAAVVFRGVQESDSPFAIPRFFVTRDEINVLKEKVLGTWDLLGRWHETAPLWLMRMVSRTLH